MKIIKKLFVVAFISIAAFACSEEDSETTEPVVETNETLILGLWKFSALTQDGEAYTLSVCELKATLNFTATQLTNIDYFEGDDASDCEQQTNETLNYTINGNTVSFGDQSVQIVSLNATTLIYEFNEGTPLRYTYTR